MLPPVDPRVLERNPNFDVLYKDLTTRKMNPDGSTRDTKKQRIHDEIRRVSFMLFSLQTMMSLLSRFFAHSFLHQHPARLRLRATCADHLRSDDI